MEGKQARNRKKSLEIRVQFHERKDGEETPPVALYRLGRDGRPEEKIAGDENGVMAVPKDLAQRAPLVGLGPDVEDPGSLDRSALLTYRAEEILRQWQERPVVELPRRRWTPWWPHFVCVTGSARKCWLLPPIVPPIPPRSVSPRLLPVPLGRGATPVPSIVDSLFPVFNCMPLCTGVVEIHERVCCCDWWEIVPQIPELIPELIPIPLPDPPFPPRGPRPDPLPFGGPLPRELSRSLRLHQATLEPARRVPMDPRVTRDLRVLSGLQELQAIHDYVVERPYLLPLFCHCSSTKVGETQLNVDGSFIFCYARSPRPSNCTVTYFYKIRQYIGGTWVTVYDGQAGRSFFSAGESATLTTYHALAETCTPPDDPPVEGQGRPFIMLQSIGTTDSHRLHSPAQSALAAVTGADNSGLLDQGYASDCPMGATLQLLLWIDPDLEGVGAEYYRFSIAQTDGAGNVQPATVQALTGSVSWRRWANGVWPPEPENVALGPVDPSTVGGASGLIRIPYYSSTNRWLGNQFHYALDTTALSNGRYALILEVFDGAGNRLRPSGAAGSGTDTNFHFIHWDTTATTSVVDYAQLVHLLHFDNTKCFADIEDLSGGMATIVEECQFKTGTGSSMFSVGYRAYHVNGHMLSYKLSYQRGLNGTGTHGTGTLDSGSTNRPPTLGSGGPAVSPAESFGHMLGDNGAGPEHLKCTFSLELVVEAKHTTGAGRIQAYDDKDDASFALEITP